MSPLLEHVRSTRDSLALTAKAMVHISAVNEIMARSYGQIARSQLQLQASKTHLDASRRLNPIKPLQPNS